MNDSDQIVAVALTTDKRRHDLSQKKLDAVLSDAHERNAFHGSAILMRKCCGPVRNLRARGVTFILAGSASYKFVDSRFEEACIVAAQPKTEVALSRSTCEALSVVANGLSYLLIDRCAGHLRIAEGDDPNLCACCEFMVGVSNSWFSSISMQSRFMLGMVLTESHVISVILDGWNGTHIEVTNSRAAFRDVSDAEAATDSSVNAVMSHIAFDDVCAELKLDRSFASIENASSPNVMILEQSVVLADDQVGDYLRESIANGTTAVDTDDVSLICGESAASIVRRATRPEQFGVRRIDISMPKVDQ